MSVREAVPDGVPAPPERGLLLAVPIAWPTVALAAVTLAVWGFAVWAGFSRTLSAPWAIALASLAAFVSFTPMHEACHYAVAGRSALNEWVCRLASIPLLVPSIGFRYVHNEHHRHTNEPDADPDYWSGLGPTWTLPFRWLTQDIHYVETFAKAIRRRPRAEVVEFVVAVACSVGTFVALMATGHTRSTLLFVILPARLAVTLLAFTFDWLPHVPHDVTSRDDRFRATVIYDHPMLTPILLGQNYHLIHHLYPAVPFYRYGRVWRAMRPELVARGARVRRLWAAAP